MYSFALGRIHVLFFFFFSSRRRHTRCLSDWSSDVCSSDLSWTVTVWNQAGAKITAGSWFETGLMDPAPDSSAWGGAKWIGGGDEDLVLYAPYLAIFDVKYALTIAQGSTRAGFVY